MVASRPPKAWIVSPLQYRHRPIHMLHLSITVVRSRKDKKSMAETETTVRATPRHVYWRQVVRAMNGQSMRALWKSGLLILTLTGLFAGYLLFNPGGSSP